MEFYKIKRLCTKLICSLITLTFFCVALTAQQFVNPFLIDASGVNSTINKVATHDATYLYGTYDAPLQLGQFELSHRGLSDVFLIKQVEGEVEWVFFGGSAGNDLAVDVHIDENNDIVIGGGFWNEAQFGDVTLTSDGSSKALFILKFDVDGIVIFQHVINGTGAKNMAGIDLVDEDIYVNGSFGGTLFSDTTSVDVTANKDVFILKLNEETGVEWIEKFGVEGENNSIDFSWDKGQSHFIVTGHFLGRIAVANDTIQTNTFDEDVFVAAFTLSGIGKWIRKVGGVLEDFNGAHCTDDEGNIYLTGSYRGIINFADGTQINTGGILNMDAYLIKFDADGNNQWARTLGDMDGTELGTSLNFADGRLYWCGYYDDGFNLDGVSFPSSSGTFNGAVATFNPEGELEQGVPIIGDAIVVPNGILPQAEGTLVYGEFQGQIELGQTFDSGVNFYGFQVSLENLVLSTNGVNINSVQVYPNPFDEILHINISIRPEQIALYDVQGRLVYLSPEKRMAHQIDLSTLGSGIYFWRAESGITGKVIKK